MDNSNPSLRKLYALALILAPLLLGISTFFWQDGELGITGGVVQVYSFVFWIPALLGVVSLLRPVLPHIAGWGTLLVCWVCIAGNNFGMEGFYRGSFAAAGADAALLAAVAAAMGPAQILALYLPGLFFPLTLLLLGVLLLRTRTVPAWCAVLICLGAVSFPLSRIPRIELLAHMADLLLLIPLAWIGWSFWQGEGTVRELSAIAKLSPALRGDGEKSPV